MTGKTRRVRSRTAVVAAAFSPDGRLLLASAADGLGVRELGPGALVRLIRTRGPAVKLALSDDSRTLAVVIPGRNGRVTPATYDLLTGRLLAKCVGFSNRNRVPTAQGGVRWYAATVRHVLLRTS